MKKTLRFTASALFLVFAASSCTVPTDRSDDDGDVDVATDLQTLTVTGFGRYCSIKWSDGDWYAYAFNDQTTKVCTYIRENYRSGGTVKRAGLFSISGQNKAVIRCDGNYYRYDQGAGMEAPSRLVTNASGRTNCVLNVSPVAMPIFNAPFTASDVVVPNSGFDFARAPYNVLNPVWLGLVDGPNLTMVNHLGEGRSGYLNDHNGHDWNMPEGRTIRAVADGEVVYADKRDVSGVACDKGGTTEDQRNFQREVIIRHTVTSGTTYDEVFYSYYAHLRSIDAVLGPITRGTKIGESGCSGCSNPAHLHLSIVRATNTAGYYVFPVATDFGNLGDAQIDPYGFSSRAGFDPWALFAHPNGAMSINLWRSGQAPDLGGWD